MNKWVKKIKSHWIAVIAALACFYASLSAGIQGEALELVVWPLLAAACLITLSLLTESLASANEQAEALLDLLEASQKMLAFNAEAMELAGKAIDKLQQQVNELQQHGEGKEDE